MDPLTVTSAVATIVGLMSDFASSRHESRQATFDEFSVWLTEHRHEEVLKAILQSDQTVLSIKALLGTDRAVLADRLDRIDRAITAVAGSIDGLSALAMAVRPGAVLSSQALSLLRTYRAKVASKGIQLRAFAGHRSFMFLDGQPGDFVITEPQFFDDDLATLVGLGLLRLEYNGKGDPTYAYTRASQALMAAGAE